MRTVWCLLLVLVAGCRADDGGGVLDDLLERRQDGYAGYLAMRADSRAAAAELVRGLADAFDGTVGTIDGDPEDCGQGGAVTEAFTYGVLAGVDDTGLEVTAAGVGRVLRAHGWTPYDVRPDPGGDQVDAERDGVAVEVDLDPGGDLVVLTSGGCFAVPEDHRQAVREDLGDERIEVPGG